ESTGGFRPSEGVASALEVVAEALWFRQPEPLVARRPVAHFLERPRVEPIDALPADLLRTHEPGVPEHAQVLRDGGLRHLERFGQLVDRAVAGAEQVEQRATGRIGNRPIYVDARFRLAA